MCGVTFHKLTQTLDAGDVILQRSVSISPYDTRETMAFRLKHEAERMMPVLFGSFHELWEAASPQLDWTYFSRAAHIERTIDFRSHSSAIRNLIRAWSGVGVFFNTNGKRLMARNAFAVELLHEAAPGHVLEQNAQRVVVATGDGVVVFRTSDIKEAAGD